MTIVIACIVAIAVIAWLLLVRPADLPVTEPESPTAYLVERRAAIYENLRDLQFEYRLGKLSDLDYQNTKRDLQKELAAVLAEMDRIKAGGAPAPAVAPAPKAVPAAVAVTASSQAMTNGAAASVTSNGVAAHDGPPYTCPFCNAHFDVDLKFCGECGKPMKKEVAK